MWPAGLRVQVPHNDTRYPDVYIVRASSIGNRAGSFSSHTGAENRSKSLCCWVSAARHLT